MPQNHHTDGFLSAHAVSSEVAPVKLDYVVTVLKLTATCPIRCLLKWLEIRSVCPMCNKPILRLHTDAPQGAESPLDPEEV